MKRTSAGDRLILQLALQRRRRRALLAELAAQFLTRELNLASKGEGRSASLQIRAAK